MAESLDSLKEKVRALRSDFDAALRQVGDAQSLQAVRDRFLGRKSGAVTALLKSLGTLAEDARREAGQELNRLKADLESRLEQAQASLESSVRDERLQRDRVDITLPGRAPARGHRHLLTATREALEDIFLSMGYEVYEGPEVDDDYHCFEALNMPPDHPARDMQDTFYLAGAPGFLLRTHTSTAQIRYMLENPHPPTVRIICPGKVYRRDDDITHSPMFQQIEALVVGPTITLADLKGTIEAFLHALFGPQYPIRFRPSFFPYTEPSMEADLACVVCGGQGCRVCKGTGWLEIMGSGVVHPAVFEAVNARLGRVAYDPEKVTGFAFGLGIERVAMVRHAIDNIRLFYENDLRFLEQFGGMKVPLSWLAEFVEVPVEPRRLADDLTLVGLAVDAVESVGTDTVLDLDITTNRVDCMNVYGVAREVSVLYGKPLRPLEVALSEAGEPAARALRVEILAPDLCPRFCARVLDVRIGPSPQWLRDRLEAVGVRPINNLVDLTNYVMMEMGQPTHAFDLAKVPEARLVIRWARDGERVTTLDGVDRALAGRVGVVAGPEAPLGLAGIMGGASSEVSDTTRTVALEAAYWDPLKVRRAAKALGMHTEASHRFERGADPEGPVTATARIAHLAQKIGAGSARPGLVDVCPAPVPRRILALRVPQLRRVLGVDVPVADARRILQGLGFGASEARGETIAAQVPTWRSDVTREVDLVEEVGRHHGFSKIPSTLPPAGGVEGLRPWQAMERAVREVLVGAGMVEVINTAFVPDAPQGSAPRVGLANPLAEDQGALRDSLVVPGLLKTLQSNLRRGARDVRIFEIGRVFLPASVPPGEERRLGLLISGGTTPHWSQRRRAADFFDVKGILEILARRVGPLDFRAAASLPSHVHPGKAARLFWNGRDLGYVGSLHPDVMAAWDLLDETVVAELNLEPVFAVPAVVPRLQPLSRFPAVERDVSVVCDEGTTAAEVEAIVRDAGGSMLRSATVTDLYQGPQVPAGKVSLTMSLVYHDPSRTLTGEEVAASMESVVAGLRARGAEIRGE